MHYFSPLVCALLLVFVPGFPSVTATKLLAPKLNSSAISYAVNSLSNVDFPLPPSWAGQIPISGASNNELFFWLFQAEDFKASQNLIIWLNGGPGCSSLTGLFYENGPLHFKKGKAAPVPNRYSWTKLSNVLYIDQPVGTGYSNGNETPSNNANATADFVLWLKTFYDHFPALKDKNTYIVGESYAGIYIPYFAQALLSDPSLQNVTLKAIVLGDPTLGNNAAMTDVVTTTYLHSQQSLLSIPSPILAAFDAADRECGFDKVMQRLTYPPPQGPIIIPGNPEGLNFRRSRSAKRKKRQTPCSSSGASTAPPLDTPALINASINNPCYASCATYTTALTYLTSTRPCFDPYNIKYSCSDKRDTSPFVTYLNRPSVKKAIHAPPQKKFEECNTTVFGIETAELVTPPAYSIVPEILGRGVKVHLYSGEWDALVNHWGTELVVQNMTWNGKQGLQHPPDNTYKVNGEVVAARWGYERGLSYHRILRAGHQAGHDRPEVMFSYVRDFVLGEGGYGTVGG
ncbi:MAG: hypothetical protein Q9220_004028 [cf. Caloplaca sp. 1 TL-2023]